MAKDLIRFFLKICIKEKQPIAKFGIVIQLSTLSTSGQNDGWKKPLKPEVTWIQKQNVESD